MRAQSKINAEQDKKDVVICRSVFLVHVVVGMRSENVFDILGFTLVC